MKEVKKYRLVPLTYAPTKLEALQEDLEQRMKGILEDESLSTSERLARYEDALKRKNNTLADEEEKGEKRKDIPIILTVPAIPTKIDSVPDLAGGDVTSVRQKSRMKQARIPRVTSSKIVKKHFGRGIDSIEVELW